MANWFTDFYNNVGNFFNNYHDNGIIPNLWKGLTGQLSQEKVNSENVALQRETNELNAQLTRERNAQDMDIAMQNLGFQRENLDYQKALQEEIFKREDTAYERAINDASRMGINPLVAAGNGGANAGAVVSTTAMNNSATPQAAQMVAPQNQMVNPANALELISPILGIVASAREQEGFSLQLDKQRLDNQRQALENLTFAHKNGIDMSNMSFIPDFTPATQREFDDVTIEGQKESNRNIKSSANRNEREDNFQRVYGSHDNAGLLLQTATDMAHQTNRGLFFDPFTNGKGLFPVLGEATIKAGKKAGSFLQSGWNWYANSMNKAYQVAGEAVNNTLDAMESAVKSGTSKVKEGASKAKSKGKEFVDKHSKWFKFPWSK